jgi:hypothetical protein
MSKQVRITIPEHGKLPEECRDFSPEENLMMIKIGCECLLEGKKAVVGLTQDEIYNKIKNENKVLIEKMELELIVERETGKKMGEKMTKMYEVQVEQLKKQLDAAIIQINSYECENEQKFQERLQKEREKCQIIVQEKEKQVDRLYDVCDKLKEGVMLLTNKSTSHKGSEGEKTFSDYAETFIDFKGFEIMDKHTQAGSGDFHLNFEEFDVLVDAKNYKKSVPISQRDKIKKDLLKNEHLNFAWLVSLNTSIDKWDKSPIMYEWVNTTQCIVYINNLSSFDDPKKILRIVWFTCKELYKMIKDVEFDETELTESKELNYKLMGHIKNMRKRIREINTTMNATRSLIQSMDDELRELLETGTHEIIQSNYSLFDEWWSSNVESTNGESSVTSTDLWYKFKQDNKDGIKELEITPEKFKQLIRTKTSDAMIIYRGKNSKGAFDIKGVKLNQENIVISEGKIEVEFVEDLKEKKQKEKKEEKEKKQKEKEEKEKKRKEEKEKKLLEQISNYIDKELEEKILEEYEDEENNIMTISQVYNIKPWQVISLLVRCKIIKKRQDARGYDIYIETDEYKLKVNE